MAHSLLTTTTYNICQEIFMKYSKVICALAALFTFSCGKDDSSKKPSPSPLETELTPDPEVTPVAETPENPPVVFVKDVLTKSIESTNLPVLGSGVRFARRSHRINGNYSKAKGGCVAWDETEITVQKLAPLSKFESKIINENTSELFSADFFSPLKSVLEQAQDFFKSISFAGHHIEVRADFQSQLTAELQDPLKPRSSLQSGCGDNFVSEVTMGQSHSLYYFVEFIDSQSLQNYINLFANEDEAKSTLSKFFMPAELLDSAALTSEAAEVLKHHAQLKIRALSAGTLPEQNQSFVKVFEEDDGCYQFDPAGCQTTYENFKKYLATANEEFSSHSYAELSKSLVTIDFSAFGKYQ